MPGGARRAVPLAGGAPAPLWTRFGQVAWAVPDIVAAKRFFREVLGVPGFAKVENIRARDTAGTYRGRPGDFVFRPYTATRGAPSSS